MAGNGFRVNVSRMVYGGYKAALSLPQTEERETWVAQADGIVRADYARQSWADGVAETVRDLRELLTAHDNGGSAGSVAKIKKTARELVRLLGED